MIKGYFGLTEAPFTKYVPAANLFHSQAWQELSARLDHIVKNRALGVITGEVGAGKSTAVRALSSRLDPIRYPFIYIADSGLGPRGFYREVLSQFGVTPAFYQRDARRQFDRVLMDAYENQGKQPVLIIDQAHLLSASMLAEVRFLTNFQFDSLSPFALILVGQPELRATLRLRAFEPVRQRISVRYHLGGLEEQETRAYIEHVLTVEGDPAGHQQPLHRLPPGCHGPGRTDRRRGQRTAGATGLRAVVEGFSQVAIEGSAEGPSSLRPTGGT